ncbi:MAG: AAA family ATPase, partial [Christensenellaceae bacterium]|nr:AAA family ATPase [Christensenellaceae bacterium]
EMDGFMVNEGIIVMAATNRVDILDPALLRAGRFDRQIYVSYPDVKGREEILKVHAKGKPLGDDVDLATVAKMTVGFIGADLENILNEAAILTARRGKEKIGMSEIEEAVSKVMMGPEKRSRVVSERDKKITAYHEVGHAICAKVLPTADPVHEVSIIPRGMAAGYTMTLPEKDESHLFRSKMVEEIVMLLGGRAAEKLVLGDITTGASNDIERATKMARSMVVKFGMSDKIGPIFHGGDQEVFLGKELGHSRDYSDEVAKEIDAEIHRIVLECYERAQDILREHMDQLHYISGVLIGKEKITGEQFEILFNGGSLDEEAPAETEDAPTEQATAPAEEQAAPEASSQTEDAPSGDQE